MTTSSAASQGALSRHNHNLPSEVASFVGRERARTELTRLLAQTRLLTLTGAGGCGKTRLALRVAADLTQSYPHGIWFVQLAPVSDSALVPRAVAAALGIRGTPGRPLLATLATALASRRLLLVLDNCEHLIGACARLAEALLRACPHLRILATSREPLRLPGERMWRVPSLTLPDAGPLPTLESLTTVEAIALFLDRAQARQPAFTLTRQNAPAVVAICRQLDGLPLGIELAAAQLTALAPAQIAARLDDALYVLGNGSRTLPRHETLRATLDWSHALLDTPEQALFRLLAVFSGSFSLEAVERVCSPLDPETATPAAVLPALRSLLEKSLVEPQAQAQETRYRLLEPVRQYAWTHLRAAGEDATVQRSHALYYLSLAETAEPHLMSGARGPWLERLASEQHNLRAALAWSRHATTEDDRAVGMRLAAALFWYWNLRGDVTEGLEWLDAALATGHDATPDVRARALYAGAELAWLVGQTTTARARAEESVRLFRALGDKRNLAYALQSLPMAIDHPHATEAVVESLRLFEEVGDAWGAAMALGALDLFALIRDGDPGGHGQARLEEALDRFRALDDAWGAAQMLNILGDLARSLGDDEGAQTHYEASLHLLRREGLTGTVPSLLHNLGYLALRRGDAHQALHLFGESLTLFRDQGDQRGIADGLAGLAGTLAAQQQPDRAARLLGAAEALRAAIGAGVWPANAEDHERSASLVRAQMDAAALASAWAAGRVLPLEQAIAEALDSTLTSSTPPNLRDGDDGRDLTAREREVAALVARGLTNRQIGTTLFITEGTARLHVKHILGKLGFTSRAQIAAWAVARGLTAAPTPL